MDDRSVQALVTSEFLAELTCLQVLEPVGPSLALREEAVRALRERFGDRLSVSSSTETGRMWQIVVPLAGPV